MEYSDKELIALIIKQIEEINKEKGILTDEEFNEQKKKLLKQYDNFKLGLLMPKL